MALKRVKRLFAHQTRARIMRVRYQHERNKGKYSYSTISLTGDLVGQLGWQRGDLVALYLDTEKRAIRVCKEEGRDSFCLGAAGSRSNCLRFYFTKAYLPLSANMCWSTEEEIKVGENWIEVRF